MHRESMIPDVPEELLRTEGINSPALYTTQQYNASMHSKSKSKLGSVGQYPAFKYGLCNVANGGTQYLGQRSLVHIS
jgi:hypothetical protein